ncbi:insulysin, insulin-degrading enzyme (macronuclear) [Tetrahymena thermophila SB210]|uniref:Insulysin, insulin-degrading enzyme n=1 Tax=Tetrahymena thermophila (strain SB210) TaxID=312017 RepID=Q22B82_TETTS|nr:insulysin, insulin-degrading enzyme [Tetrahymena thermophila SB210]EAR82571.1 insulysin, insulin-degrading enzyme [Tetrahymena thermophila SB210]|eukprot:XP_001030234.1 insulysin, insulin-degrading enzyme [Tetrahymena thermophila SB210]
MSVTLQQPVASKSDDRKYKLIKLPVNDIEILLISDPTTDKSSAAVNVNAGQLQDPIERQGLAHFLEHMLFLGTKKYPDASQFDQHLNQYSGYSNAFTALDQTNYFFHCSNAGFKEALDRFAWFFIEPLFTKELTSREMNAVNSENQKNLQQDLWREYQLNRSTSKEGNPFNKFGTGNLETLNFESTREDLIKFYNQYYSSNLTKVVILSNETLEELETQAVELFSQIPNRKLPKPVYKESPFDSTNLKKFLKIVPCKQEKRLKFSWVLPNYEKNYRKNPTKLFSYLYGHEGEHSLLSALMDAGYAEALRSSESQIMGLFSQLSVTVVLTEQGFENYEKVINFVSAYTKMLKEKANQQWVYDEFKNISQLKFDFKDKEEPIDYTYEIATAMQECEYIDILRTDNAPEPYDKDLLQSALDALIVDNLRITLISPTLTEECNLTEKYYQTKYSIEPISESIIKAFENPQIPHDSKKMDLPPKNTLLPQKFDLFTSETDAPPKDLLNNEFIELWYKQDSQFKIPKVTLKLRFKNNDCGLGLTARAEVQTKLWTNLFNEFTRELRYQAEMALLDSNLEFKQELTLTVDGFSDSITNFMELYLQKLVEFDVSKLQKEFQIQLNKLQKDLKNFFKQPPYQQGNTYNEYFLQTRTFSPKQLQEESLNIQFDTFVEFSTNFLKALRLELLIGGSLTSESALNIGNICTAHIFEKRGAKPVKKSDLIDRRVIQPAVDQVYVYTETLGEEETNNYICANYEDGESVSVRSRVIMELLGNVFSESFFTQLRTNECLGYICWSRTNAIRGVGFVRFIIQSDVQPPQYLASRIHSFLQQQKIRLEELTSEQFEKIRAAVEVDIREKDFSIKKQTERYFEYIVQHHYTFDLKEKMIEELKKIKLADLVQAFKKIFFTNKRCSQLHLVSPKHVEQNALYMKVTQPYSGFENITNPESIKFKCSLHPDYYTYKI